MPASVNLSLPKQARFVIRQVSQLLLFKHVCFLCHCSKILSSSKLRFKPKTYLVFKILLCDLGEKHQLLFVLGVLEMAPLCKSMSLWHCMEQHPKVSKAFICPVHFAI